MYSHTPAQQATQSGSEMRMDSTMHPSLVVALVQLYEAGSTTTVQRRTKYDDFEQHQDLKLRHCRSSVSVGLVSAMYLARKAEPKASKLLFQKEMEMKQKRHRFGAAAAFRAARVTRDCARASNLQRENQEHACLHRQWRAAQVQAHEAELEERTSRRRCLA
jgi:hypothetical protein